MDKRVTGIVAYLTWVGLIISFVIGDREGAKFHLNQSLVIWLVGTIVGLMNKVPLVGGIISVVGGIFCALCWFIGIINAIQGIEKPVPVLGQIQLLK